MKNCFFGVDDTEASADGAPAPAKALEGDSIETELEEAACITERWKRAGIEVESWVVGGRIRRAEIRKVKKNQRLVVFKPTNLNRGRR